MNTIMSSEKMIETTCLICFNNLTLTTIKKHDKCNKNHDFCENCVNVYKHCIFCNPSFVERIDGYVITYEDTINTNQINYLYESSEEDVSEYVIDENSSLDKQWKFLYELVGAIDLIQKNRYKINCNILQNHPIRVYKQLISYSRVIRF